jgi:hypothetical protein
MDGTIRAHTTNEVQGCYTATRDPGRMPPPAHPTTTSPASLLGQHPRAKHRSLYCCWSCGWLEARSEEPPRFTVWVFCRKSECSW